MVATKSCCTILRRATFLVALIVSYGHCLLCAGWKGVGRGELYNLPERANFYASVCAHFSWLKVFVPLLYHGQYLRHLGLLYASALVRIITIRA